MQRIYFGSFLGLFVFECIYFPDLCFPILKNGPIFVCTDPATAQHSVFFNICSENIWKILLPHFCANSYSTCQHVFNMLSQYYETLGRPSNTIQRIFSAKENSAKKQIFLVQKLCLSFFIHFRPFLVHFWFFFGTYYPYFMQK